MDDINKLINFTKNYFSLCYDPLNSFFFSLLSRGAHVHESGNTRARFRDSNTKRRIARGVWPPTELASSQAIQPSPVSTLPLLHRHRHRPSTRLSFELNITLFSIFAPSASGAFPQFSLSHSKGSLSRKFSNYQWRFRFTHLRSAKEQTQIFSPHPLKFEDN